MVETTRERPRRDRDGFWSYLNGQGIDIGCGNDPLTPDCQRWDAGHGDAHDLDGVGTKDWVYSSHCLEHLADPVRAVRRWWDVLRSGGTLVVVVPHRDLYERRRTLPSQWNRDHKTFWLPYGGEPPCTFGLLDVVAVATRGQAVLERLHVARDGWVPVPLTEHPVGSYSIEGIWRKP